MPDPIGLYLDVRSQLALFEKLTITPMGLLSMFGGNDINHLSNVMQLTTVKKGSQCAIYVRSGDSPTIVGGTKVKANVFDAKLINMEKPFTADYYTDKPIPGESFLNPVNPSVRRAYWTGIAQKEQIDAIQIAKQVQIAQAFTTGTMTFNFDNQGGTETVVNSDSTTHFPKNGTTENPYWSETTADVDGDLFSDIDLVGTDGNKGDTITIMGADALAAFFARKGDKILNSLYAATSGSVPPTFRDYTTGIRFEGNYPRIGEVYSFSGKYTDIDGVSQTIFPKNMVLTVSKTIPTAFHNGLLPILDGNFQSPILGYVERKDSQHESVITMARPVFWIDNVDEFVCRQVLA